MSEDGNGNPPLTTFATLQMETPDPIQQVLEKFTPVGTYLLVEPKLSAEKSTGGIIIPEQARNPLNQGKILKVGDGLSEDEWRVDSVVMWTQHSEYKLAIDGVELILVTIDNVILRSART